MPTNKRLSAETNLALTVALDALTYLEILKRDATAWVVGPYERPLYNFIDDFAERAERLLKILEPEVRQLLTDKLKLNAEFVRQRGGFEKPVK